MACNKAVAPNMLPNINAFFQERPPTIESSNARAAFDVRLWIVAILEVTFEPVTLEALNVDEGGAQADWSPVKPH